MISLMSNQKWFTNMYPAALQAALVSMKPFSFDYNSFRMTYFRALGGLNPFQMVCFRASGGLNSFRKIYLREMGGLNLFRMGCFRGT